MKKCEECRAIVNQFYGSGLRLKCRDEELLKLSELGKGFGQPYR